MGLNVECHSWLRAATARSLAATAEGNTADFRRLVCEMPDPAWVLDGERVVCASRTLCQLLRHSDPGALADMPGSTLESHLTPSGQSRIRLLAADGSTSTVELHRSARVGLRLEVMRPVEASVGLGVDVLEGLTSQLLEGTDTSISEVLRTLSGFLGMEMAVLGLVAGWIARMLETRRTVDELRDVRCQLEELARTDALTRLPNRRSVLETARREVVRSRRYSTPVCLALLDIDRFKRLNDALGNERGDQIIRMVARTLTRHLREVDIIGRFGGQRFLLVLPNTDAWQVVVPAQRVLAAVRTINADGMRLTASIGIAPVDVKCGVDAALERAERALEQAKEQGRDQFAVWSDADPLDA